MIMVLPRHTFCYGDSLTLSMSDAFLAALANGAVCATRTWIEASGCPPLEQLGLAYEHPQSDDGLAQLTRIGPEIPSADAITCLEAAIFHAGWMQAHGVEAWVMIVRESIESPGHAVVFEVELSRQIDPTAWLRMET